MTKLMVQASVESFLETVPEGDVLACTVQIAIDQLDGEVCECLAGVGRGDVMVKMLLRHLRILSIDSGVTPELAREIALGALSDEEFDRERSKNLLHQ